MPTILTKGNVYLGKSLFGQFSKFTAPDIDMATSEIKNAIGSYNLPTAINVMKSTLTLIGFDKEVFSKVGNPYQELNLTAYGSLDKYSNETLESSEQAKLVIRGSSQKFSLLGELEQQNNIEQAIEFNVSAAKLYINNVEKYAIDIPNLVWRVNGVDILATVRKNLGIN